MPLPGAERPENRRFRINVCVLVLALFGLDSEKALGCGILLQAVVLPPLAVLGLVFWGLHGFDLGGANQSATMINSQESDAL